jgi:hypothetical protein
MQQVCVRVCVCVCACACECVGGGCRTHLAGHPGRSLRKTAAPRVMRNNMTHASQLQCINRQAGRQVGRQMQSCHLGEGPAVLRPSGFRAISSSAPWPRAWLQADPKESAQMKPTEPCQWTPPTCERNPKPPSAREPLSPHPAAMCSLHSTAPSPNPHTCSSASLLQCCTPGISRDSPGCARTSTGLAAAPPPPAATGQADRQATWQLNRTAATRLWFLASAEQCSAQKKVFKFPTRTGSEFLTAGCPFHGS